MSRASAFVSLLIFGDAAASNAAASPPNMVWIMSDDLGYGELSILSGRTNTNISTPNIDALFKSGIHFTDAYCGEAVCAPSRGSLMTGYHMGHAYIRGNHDENGSDMALRHQDTTFLEILQKNGYHVACVGKWGLGEQNSTGAPWLKGCSEYFGVLGQSQAHNMYPSDPSFTWYYPGEGGGPASVGFPANLNASRARCMAANNTCVWSHELWTQHALAVLQAQAEREAAAARAGTTAAPLFLYLAYTDPHAGGWSGEVEAGNPVPSDGAFARHAGAWPPAEMDHASVIENFQVRVVGRWGQGIMFRLTPASVIENFQDADVGALVAALAQHGLADSTLVVYASDNGASNEGNHDYMFFESSGPLRGFKRCLTDGGIRTQLAVAWPGRVPAGVTTNYTAAFWDFFPTLLALGGVPAADIPATDGTDLSPLILGGAPPPHPPLYWEFCSAARPYDAPPRSGAGWGRAVRMGDWKGVWFFYGPPHNQLFLYDLAADIGETTDVAKQHPDIVAQMEAFAAAAHVNSTTFPMGEPCVPS